MKRATLKRAAVAAALLIAVFANATGAKAGGAARLDRIEKEFAPVLALSGTAAAKEINAIANLITPKSGMMTIDLKHASAELCMLEPSTRKYMVHFSPTPEKTKEDIIYFINPAAFKAAGLQTAKLPTLPKELNKMVPLQWYYYDGKTKEPHHGKVLKTEFLVMAIDVK